MNYNTLSKDELIEVLEERDETIKNLHYAASIIRPYLAFTVSDESPGYHPTMPSAVHAFKRAFSSPPGTIVEKVNVRDWAREIANR